jgi:hypothetical protein
VEDETAGELGNGGRWLNCIWVGGGEAAELAGLAGLAKLGVQEQGSK